MSDKNVERVTRFPEHGPFDRAGREVLLEVRNMDITFGKGENAVHAVNNANFKIYRGETFSLVGESGSGKTTVGRAIVRVNPLSAGEIYYKGVRISGNITKELDRDVIRHIQMIFQDPASSLNERATVDYIVSEGLYNFHLYENEKDRVRKVETIMDQVGLLHEHLTRYPHEFSGGQRQRIGLARAMVMEPEFVVADEPISALDVSVRAQVLNLLNKFKKEKGVSYLFIAHDLSIVRYISDRIGVIYKGNIVEIASTQELFNYPIHPYTRSLMSAIPIPDPELEKNKDMYIYNPELHDYSVDKPDLVDIGNDHWVYGNPWEIEEYKAMRARNEPIKSINILPPDEIFRREMDDSIESEKIRESVYAGSNYILDHPVKDTGSLWYGILSFLFPIFGLIAAVVYRKKNYIRNYKVCRTGALICLGMLGAIFLLFLIMLFIATRG